jgi:hypothetical protein
VRLRAQREVCAKARAIAPAILVALAEIAFLTGCAAEVPRAASPESVVFHDDALIAADLKDVWRTLVDLPKYEEWNPWLLHAEGDLEPGGVVWADVLLGKSSMHAKHVVLAVDPMKRLCWRDAGWNAVFVYAQRCRTLEPLPNGVVKLDQEIMIDGCLSGLADAMFGEALGSGLRAETKALKHRAESLASLRLK